MKRIIITAVAVVFCCSTLAMAEADIGFKGIGAKIGYVAPQDIDGNFILGAFADLGTFAPRVGFEAGIDYWSSSEGVDLAEVDYTDIAIGARAKYLFTVTNEKWKPYAGGGLSIHFFTVDIPETLIPGVGSVGGSDTKTKIGLDLVGGSRYTAGENIDVIGEAMYRIVSDVGQFVIFGGVVYWFGG